MIQGNKINYKECACLSATGVCTAFVHTKIVKGKHIIVGKKRCPFYDGKDGLCFDFWKLDYNERTE